MSAAGIVALPAKAVTWFSATRNSVYEKEPFDIIVQCMFVGVNRGGDGPNQLERLQRFLL